MFASINMWFSIKTFLFVSIGGIGLYFLVVNFFNILRGMWGAIKDPLVILGCFTVIPVTFFVAINYHEMGTIKTFLVSVAGSFALFAAILGIGSFVSCLRYDWQTREEDVQCRWCHKMTSRCSSSKVTSRLKKACSFCGKQVTKKHWLLPIQVPLSAKEVRCLSIKNKRSKKNILCLMIA